MIQEVKQTHEEKIKMYMACTKKELIEMLIEANRILDTINLFVNQQKNYGNQNEKMRGEGY